MGKQRRHFTSQNKIKALRQETNIGLKWNGDFPDYAPGNAFFSILRAISCEQLN